MRVAAVQTDAHNRAAFTERWPALVAQIAAAAEGGARLVVVPEGTVPAYVIGTAPVDPQQLEAAARDVIAVAARTGATIVYGAARAHEQGVANSAYVVTADGVRGFADKCFLWHFDRRWFTAGETLEPIDTPVGRLGVFICADGRLPTIGAALAARGAEALVVPTAWVTSGRDPAALENIQADLFAPVRARENDLPLIAANKCGVEARSVRYCGKSLIVERDGSVVARAPQDEAATISGKVTFGASGRRFEAPPPAVVRGEGPPLPAVARIAFAARTDDELRALAALADATFVIDGAATPASVEIALAGDEAFADPRGLVAARLAGVRLFVWRATEDGWTRAYARTRAAELRCYVVAFAGAEAFAVDPDGTVVAATGGAFELAAFAFDRARTDTWTVAPGTDVRAGLERVARLTGVPA